MLNNLIIWVMTQRLNRILRLIMDSSQSKDEVRINLLRGKYNLIADRRAIRIIKSLKPMSHAAYIARYMCIYMLMATLCLFMLVYFTMKEL